MSVMLVACAPPSNTPPTSGSSVADVEPAPAGPAAPAEPAAAATAQALSEATSATGDTAASPAQAPPRNTFVYRCEERGTAFELVTRTGPGEIAVWLPERFGGGYFVLGQVPSASGVRYEGDGLLVWTHGDEALLDVRGERFTACAYEPGRSIWEHARLSGVDFRATGNEPGWHLEIRDGERIEFVYDYGAGRVVAPVGEPGIDPVSGETRYTAIPADDEPLEVAIRRLRCNDTMSGDLFDATVIVRLGARQFHGCGRRLE